MNYGFYEEKTIKFSPTTFTGTINIIQMWKFIPFVMRIPNNPKDLDSYVGEWVSELQRAVQFANWGRFVECFLTYFEEMVEYGLFEYEPDQYKKIVSVISTEEGYNALKKELTKFDSKLEYMFKKDVTYLIKSLTIDGTIRWNEYNNPMRIDWSR